MKKEFSRDGGKGDKSGSLRSDLGWFLTGISFTLSVLTLLHSYGIIP